MKQMPLVEYWSKINVLNAKEMSWNMIIFFHLQWMCVAIRKHHWFWMVVSNTCHSFDLLHYWITHSVFFLLFFQFSWMLVRFQWSPSGYYCYFVLFVLSLVVSLSCFSSKFPFNLCRLAIQMGKLHRKNESRSLLSRSYEPAKVKSLFYWLGWQTISNGSRNYIRFFRVFSINYDVKYGFYISFWF